MAEKKSLMPKKSTLLKKEAAPKERTASKESGSYCVCIVKPAAGMEYPFKEAGTFRTMEEAEAYVAANPQWPQLQARKA